MSHVGLPSDERDDRTASLVPWVGLASDYPDGAGDRSCSLWSMDHRLPSGSTSPDENPSRCLHLHTARQIALTSQQVKSG